MSAGIDIPLISKFDKTGLKQAQDAFGGFGKNLGKIAGAVAAAFSVRAITNFAKEAVSVAEAAQTAQNRLEAVAKATGVFGDATEAVTGRLAEFAKSQEMRIAVDDKVIKGVQAQLLTFKELSKSADETGGAFDRATIAAFDMAAAGFGTAEGNAVALAKALEDPSKGLVALGRSGTIFTEQQKEQIKVLQESGDLLGAQELILKEVESQYGGVAEETADASDRIAIAFENIKEQAGGPLLDIFADLVDALLPVIELIGDELEQAFIDLSPVLTDLAGMLPGLIEAFVPLIPALGQIAGLFLELVAQLLPPFIAFFDQILPLILELAPILTEVLLEILSAAGPIIMELASALIPIVQMLLPPLLEILEATAPVVMALIDAFLPLIMRILPILIGLLEFLLPIGLFLAELLGTIIVGAVNLLLDGFELAKKFFSGFGEFFENLWNGIANFFIDIVNSLIGMFEGFVNLVIRGVNEMIRLLNNFKVQVPDWAIFGALRGKEFSLNIPSLSNVEFGRIPRLADGGIVNRETLAIIGEAGPEAVVPLDKMGSMGGANIVINVNAGVGTDGPAVGRAIVAEIKKYERSSGRVFASA